MTNGKIDWDAYFKAQATADSMFDPYVLALARQCRAALVIERARLQDLRARSGGTLGDEVRGALEVNCNLIDGAIEYLDFLEGS